MSTVSFYICKNKLPARPSRTKKAPGGISSARRCTVLHMSAAGMAVSMAAVVLAALVMVIAHGVRIVVQAALQQRIHRRVRISGHAGIKLDARLSQSHSGAAADSTADQCIHAVSSQKSRQRFMAVAACAHHLGRNHRIVRNLVNLEGLTVPKVLEYLLILICYRNFHSDILLICFHSGGRGIGVFRSSGRSTGLHWGRSGSFLPESPIPFR